jgi:hypothetical protein
MVGNKGLVFNIYFGFKRPHNVLPILFPDSGIEKSIFSLFLVGLYVRNVHMSTWIKENARGGGGTFSRRKSSKFLNIVLYLGKSPPLWKRPEKYKSSF